MEGHRDGDLVRVGSGARQRFHDNRGYGRPAGDGELLLAPVEAAHLLFRGDLAAVDGEGFAAYLERESERVGSAFAAYADLRERGYYLAPARPDRIDDPPDCADLAVFQRGTGPGDGAIAHWVRVVGEREVVTADSLGAVVLAVVDEEGEVTYFETSTPSPTGESATQLPEVTGTLLADSVVAWDPPAALYAERFYGQPLAGRAGDPTGPVQLSLVEAAYLAERGALAVAGGMAAIRNRGRDVEGDRFDYRLAAYTVLRGAGLVPKTGFKFGADFRTYEAVESIDDLGHSEALVRVCTPATRFEPRELSLHVRLAGGVRKRQWYALVADGAVSWVEVGRLTP